MGISEALPGPSIKFGSGVESCEYKKLEGSSSKDVTQNRDPRTAQSLETRTSQSSVYTKLIVAGFDPQDLRIVSGDIVRVAPNLPIQFQRNPMKDTVPFRPKAPSIKIRTSDDFELCYIRHQYFRRVKYNPTPEEMAPYMYIVEHLTKNTFFTYFNLFKAVGMYHDDVLNVGRVHLVSFLGLYALEKMPAKKKEFAERFEKYNYKEAEEKDFDQKNKANFTMFFKQRMEDLVRVCRQKVRNIKGQPSEEYVVFYGKKEPPKYPRKLLTDSESLGYKRLDFSVFKSIRKKADVNHDATIFEFNGTWYVAFPVDQKGLELEDIIGSGSNPYENLHNMRPDELLEEKEALGFGGMFGEQSLYKKRILLRNFIEKNKYKRYYREELTAARRLLRALGD
jgi:hypothetical protein